MGIWPGGIREGKHGRGQPARYVPPALPPGEKARHHAERRKQRRDAQPEAVREQDRRHQQEHRDRMRHPFSRARRQEPPLPPAEAELLAALDTEMEGGAPLTDEQYREKQRQIAEGERKRHGIRRHG